MRTTQSLQFYCRPSKENKDGMSPLELSIVLNGERKFINLPVKFSPRDFNRARPPKEITECMDAWRYRITDYTTQMMNQGIPVTAESLREVIRTGGVKNYTVGDLFNDYLSILKVRIGQDLTANVYRKYELIRDKFYKFISPESSVTHITNSLIQGFYAHLNKTYDQSTSAGYMTKLKTFIRFAMDNDRLKVNPFQGIKISKGRKEIITLTEDEIKRIGKAELYSDSLNKVRDCFLIMCGTGLAYIDLKDLRKEDIKRTPTRSYIEKRRHKTNQPYTAVVLPFALDIIDKYDRLPVISNQKMNAYLKQIAVMANIDPNKVHCHTGRKTYGQLLISKGVRMETVARTLGHSSTKITESYYCRPKTNDVLQEVSSVMK